MQNCSRYLPVRFLLPHTRVNTWRRATWTAAALAAAVLLQAPPARAAEPEFDESFDRSYRLAPGGTFALTNINGSVQVDGWEREEVQIHAVKTARGNAQDLARVRIEVAAEAGKVSVRTVYPPNEGVEVNVEYKVRVPQRVLLARVETVNGSVRVRGVDGSGELRTVNGHVELLDGGGRFNARTTNGNVRMELHELDADGALSLQTVNGSIVLVVPPDASADLEVDAMNGDFESDLPVTMRGSLSAQAFRGRLGKGGGAAVKIASVNGPIRVVTARPVI